MDHEYLQNVMGSPYVNEGAFDRLKAKGAQAMGALGAMAGHQIQSPAETKLRSLWEGFMSSLKKIMKDWEGQVSPMFDQKVPLTTEKQKQVKDALDALARTLAPVGPQKIGTAPDDFADPGVRTQRRNPDTFVKGNAYNRSTTSPTKLTEIVDEGFWDAAKRDMGLNKALGSNDPSKILDAYKNQVLSAFQSFMKDAVKMTKMTAQQIYGLLSKMQPAKGGWQAAGNMQKVVEHLKSLQAMGDISGEGEPPVAHPPAAPGEQPPVIQKPTAQPPPIPKPAEQPVPPVIPKAAEQPVPPVIPKEQPPEPQKPGEAPPAAPPTQAAGKEVIDPKEYPYIILHAIRIINNAVTSDESHAGHFFDKDNSGKYTPLPTGWDEPSVTKESSLMSLLKEIHSDPKPKGGKVAKGGESDQEEPEVPGEFLYNFHSKFSKHPGKPFNIEVKPVGMSNEVPELPGVKIQVIWQNEDTLNDIYVIAEKNGKKTKPLLIMEFYDDDVSSQTGATDPSSTNIFSVDKLVQSSDPDAASKLAGAPPKVKQAIQNEQELLLRSLMATTYRKGMEFKSKAGKNVFPLKFDTAGNVYYHHKNGKPSKNISDPSTSINQAGVEQKLEGEYKEAEMWTDSLEHYGYFDQFKGLKPKDITEYPAYNQAYKELAKGGMEDATIGKLLPKAWTELSQTKAQKDITAAELIANVTGESTPGVFGEPEAEPDAGPQAYEDAKLALQKLGVKDIDKKLQQAWVDLSATKSEDEITASDLTQAVVSGKKPTPTATVPTKESGWTISGWNNDGSLNIKTKEGDKLLNKMHVKRLDEPTRKHLESMGYWDQFPDVEGKPSAVSGAAGAPPPSPKPDIASLKKAAEDAYKEAEKYKDSGPSPYGELIGKAHKLYKAWKDAEAEEKAKTSAPVSKSPSAPAATTQPSAPVSNAPMKPQSPEKKAAKKGATQPIEIWKDPNQDPKDNLMWKNKKGKIGGLNPEKAKEFMSDAEFAKAWQAAKDSGFKPPKDYENLEESFVNPFQAANLLL